MLTLNINKSTYTGIRTNHWPFLKLEMFNLKAFDPVTDRNAHQRFPLHNFSLVITSVAFSAVVWRQDIPAFFLTGESNGYHAYA